MKPRIHRHGGGWCCCSGEPRAIVNAWGRTAIGAYKEWLKRYVKKVGVLPVLVKAWGVKK